jgi:uncharacterized protein
LDWYYLLAGLLVLIGLFGTLLPVLPGLPLVFAGLWLIAWTDGFAKVSMLTVGILGFIAALSMLIDFFASLITTKKVGASKTAMWGIVIGGVLGLFAGVFGLFFGAAIGALVGELIAYRDASRATTVGLAAGLGFVIGFIAKIVLSLLMLGVFAFAYYYY